TGCFRHRRAISELDHVLLDLLSRGAALFFHVANQLLQNLHDRLFAGRGGLFDFNQIDSSRRAKDRSRYIEARNQSRRNIRTMTAAQEADPLRIDKWPVTQ